MIQSHYNDKNFPLDPHYVLVGAVPVVSGYITIVTGTHIPTLEGEVPW
jgi:hypothetical protein